RVDVARVAGGEVVHHCHLVPGREEGVDHVGPDEAGAARDEDLHDWATSFLHQSMVRCRPSSTSTFGSHCSSRRALPISGCRTLGSSVGNGRNTISLRDPLSRAICSASRRSLISRGLPMLTGSLTGACIRAQIPSTRPWLSGTPRVCEPARETD